MTKELDVIIFSQYQNHSKHDNVDFYILMIEKCSLKHLELPLQNKADNWSITEYVVFS